MYTRALRVLLAVMIVSALMPLGTASAARNRAPRILKAVMKDGNGNGLADRVVLTYSEKIRHKADFSRFPFVVQGYKIAKVGAVRGKTTLAIALKENANAPAKPASIKYTRTRKQPVLDLKRMQAAKQLLTKNIIGLNVPPPPPPPSEEFTLTVSKSGDGVGEVNSSDSKIVCGTTCTAKYPAGTSVTLTATPDAASKATFGSWTGCTSETQSCTLTMDADKTVTASFTKAGNFALSVVKDAAGTGTGTVTSTSTPTQSSQINCGATCTASFAKDTLVTLKAVPDATSKSTIAGWSGGGCSGTGDTCNVLMDAVKSVTIKFNKPVEQTLTVSNNGGTGSGAVTSSDGKINCGTTCTAKYPKDSTVTLTVSPATGSVFAGWGGAATCPVTATSCQVTVSSDPTTVTTIFNLSSTTITTHSLAVAKTGVGSVTSTPGGINCPETALECTSASFPAGTVVTLTATPGLGMEVKQWTGDCSGTGLTCTVTMDANKAVGVEFQLATPDLPALPPNVQP